MLGRVCLLGCLGELMIFAENAERKNSEVGFAENAEQKNSEVGFAEIF